MNFDEFQLRAQSTVLSRDSIPNSVHWSLGAVGEAYEIVTCPSYDREEEIGDFLWYLANLATDLGLEYEGEAWSISEMVLNHTLNGYWYENSYTDELIGIASEIAELVKKITFYISLPEGTRNDYLSQIKDLIASGIMTCYHRVALNSMSSRLSVILDANISKLEKRHAKS